MTSNIDKNEYSVHKNIKSHGGPQVQGNEDEVSK